MARFSDFPSIQADPFRVDKKRLRPFRAHRIEVVDRIVVEGICQMLALRVGLLAISGFMVGTGTAWAQTPSQAPSQAPVAASTATSDSAAAKKKAAAARRKAAPAGPVQAIPMETAPPSPPTAPVVEAQQKAADQKLLEQQQAQSAQAAAITDQQVEAAQKQKDAIQNEVRIQDAPGPAQTGVVPAAGVPVAPVNVNDRIQDAPGPAQTLAPLPKTVPTPAQPAPATTPPQF
jgi:hypothetical protein